MHQVSFTDAYKEWRRHARKFNPHSIVRRAIETLGKRSSNQFEDLEQAPWLTMLAVKWVCQDRYPDRASLPSISPQQLYDLRQMLWKFPELVAMGSQNDTPLELFKRQLLRPQLGFQREFSKSFVREAALLAEQNEDYPLRRLFKEKSGYDVLHFIDLGLATCTKIMAGNRVLHKSFFNSLNEEYTPDIVSSFQHSMSRTFPQLVKYCRSLPDAENKNVSEYFEFPVLTRYPFFYNDDTMTCWHPMVFFRGLESFVHSVLSEKGQEYMQRFSKLFERHVVAEAGKTSAEFIDDDALRGLIAINTKVPDGLLSFPGCNVFIEAKAGLNHESVMTVGNSENFARKTKAIKKAVGQAWATSVSLRERRLAPHKVLDADANYLLIVTNKELGVSKGTALASMYPERTLEYPNAEAERILPLKHIYVLPINDFERLITAATSRQIELPAFLASCVRDDEMSRTTVYLFEQHLDRRGVPLEFSRTVELAVEDSLLRLKGALSS